MFYEDLHRKVLLYLVRGLGSSSTLPFAALGTFIGLTRLFGLSNNT